MLKKAAETTETESIIEDKATRNKTSESSSKKTKSAPKAPTIETDATIKPSEKKRKAPKVPPKTNESFDYDYVDETAFQTTIDEEKLTQLESNQDQEVPVKSKKKRAPKIETTNEDNEATIITEEPKKKKKSKAPKAVKPDDDDTQQNFESQTVIDALDSTTETKPKGKKTKKSKREVQPLSDSFENLQVTNLDDTFPTYTGTNDTAPIIDSEHLQSGTEPFDNNAREYEQNILNSFNELASSVSFSEYVGNDQWYTMHLPKSARTEPKSRIRKILPGGHSKDEKSAKKNTVPKGGLLTRLRAGVTSLVSDENNMIFGDQGKYDAFEYDDDSDNVDTDDLNRYAQKLRELEDHDRQINPEFLVIRDGKTVYGVHEEDTDGKVKLSSRKPIYDRFADQAADQQSEKKKLLARLKKPFSRNKDKDGKEGKSTNGTPNAEQNRKLDGDLTTTAGHDNVFMN